MEIALDDDVGLDKEIMVNTGISYQCG